MANTNIHVQTLSVSPDLNTRLLDGFHQYHELPEVRRTHLFHGRYENVYLTENEIPALADLMAEVRRHASLILGIEHLRVGYWFNAMPPGAVTTRHSHDDDDELLSGVYYVQVPPDSGDLILYDAEPPTRITPVTGQLIFFPPNIDHEVTRNNSSEDRLSIGMNFGPIHKD